MRRSLRLLGIALALLPLASVASAQAKRGDEYVVQLARAFNPEATTKRMTRLEAAGFKDLRVLTSPTQKGRVYRVVMKPAPTLGDARLQVTEAKRIARAKKVTVDTTILRAAEAGQPLVR